MYACVYIFLFQKPEFWTGASINDFNCYQAKVVLAEDAVNIKKSLKSQNKSSTLRLICQKLDVII